MHKTRYFILWLSAGLLASNSLVAFADDSGFNQVRQTLKTLLPADQSPELRDSAVAGIVEARVGSQVIYITRDGQHILNGPLIDTHNQQNLSEVRLEEHRASLSEQINQLNPVQYPSSDGRHTITVITDVDCPYCRQLHQDMNSYHAAGINVQYLMLPRLGKESESYRKTRHALCAEQPADAITLVMNLSLIHI